jgi:hypothetical protein
MRPAQCFGGFPDHEGAPVREQVGYERFDRPALTQPMRRFYEAYEPGFCV